MELLVESRSEEGLQVVEELFLWEVVSEHDEEVGRLLHTMRQQRVHMLAIHLLILPCLTYPIEPFLLRILDNQIKLKQPLDFSCTNECLQILLILKNKVLNHRINLAR